MILMGKEQKQAEQFQDFCHAVLQFSYLEEY